MQDYKSDMGDLNKYLPAPEVKRGDPVCGRTVDEERRPLVCFVCANRVAVSFNFCLEHKDEYERLRAANTVAEANLADYAKRYFDLFEMFRGAWLREMGGVIRPKHWEIDGFVLRMRDIYEKAQLVDRMKQIMVKRLHDKCSAEEMFDAVFEMLAKNKLDTIPTN